MSNPWQWTFKLHFFTEWFPWRMGMNESWWLPKQNTFENLKHQCDVILANRPQHETSSSSFITFRSHSQRTLTQSSRLFSLHHVNTFPEIQTALCESPSGMTDKDINHSLIIGYFVLLVWTCAVWVHCSRSMKKFIWKRMKECFESCWGLDHSGILFHALYIGQIWSCINLNLWVSLHQICATSASYQTHCKTTSIAFHRK